MDANMLRRCVAEFIGTFTLIFIGGGAGIVSGHEIVAVALANGLAIGIMVTNLGHISGGHFNPSITLGFLATRRITRPLAIAYWIAQFAGAIVAAAILRGLFTHEAFLGEVPHADGFGAGKGLVVEIILTFFLVGAVFATAVDPRGAFKSIAGLAIGLTITMDVFFGGPLTGAAMNPARAFGPELVGNIWSQGWIYWIGPAIGALTVAQTSSSSWTRSPLNAADASTRVGARSSFTASLWPAASWRRASVAGPSTRNRQGCVRWWFGARRASDSNSSSVSRGTGSGPK